tara:strand:- start:671 stop:895 length:225 start_codon:yes stop_codon:yes gene_type:complete
LAEAVVEVVVGDMLVVGLEVVVAVAVLFKVGLGEPKIYLPHYLLSSQQVELEEQQLLVEVEMPIQMVYLILITL